MQTIKPNAALLTAGGIKNHKEDDTMGPAQLHDFITEAIARHHALAIELSDDLYAHPELPDQEFRSSAKMVELLKAAGYEVEYPYMGYPTAFRAELSNGPGPHAAILVEYDALPGLGHACGHNVHGSMSILAALALMDLKDQFPGKLSVIGTPAEEEDGKKIGMAARGAFDGLDLAVMNHSYSGGVSLPDMDLLGLQCYILDFHGTSAHAAAGPWKGHSALACARKFLDLVDARRECFTGDIRFNGVILDGGRAPNILPDKAQVRLEYRADSRAKMNMLNDIMHKCAKGASIALDCEYTYAKGFDGFDDMVCVPALQKEVSGLIKALGHPCGAPQTPSGSSDVGNTSYRCPTIQPLIAICQAPYALHTIEFREETIKEPAHKAIADGAQLIAELVYRTMTDESFRSEVNSSFQAALKAKLDA